MRYTPFTTDLKDLEPADLDCLRHTAEGWYIEYKQEVNDVRSIAKSVTAFANTYGGWLFYGIGETEVDGSKVAGAFPGIPDSDLGQLLERIATACARHASPTPFYETTVLHGPEPLLGLAAGNAVVVVKVPQGNHPPHVHVTGRIYRRKGDRSDPVPETDRSVLDLLWERGRAAEDRLKGLFGNVPSVSEGEAKSLSYLHIHILSDPFDHGELVSAMSLRGFHDIMVLGKGVPTVGDVSLPSPGFDNVFRCGDDYIARQVAANSPENLVLTYRYRPNISSLVSVPMPRLRPRGVGPEAYNAFVKSGEHAVEFLSLLEAMGHRFPTVVDLTLTFPMLVFAMHRHKQLAHVDGYQGPFDVKLVFDNVWRVIPFVDTAWQIDLIRERGAPVVQDARIYVPGSPRDLLQYGSGHAAEDAGPEATDGLGTGELTVVTEGMASLGVPVGGLDLEELTALTDAWYRSAANASGEPVEQ